MTFTDTTSIGDLIRLRSPSTEIHAYVEGSPYTVTVWQADQVAFVWRVAAQDQALWLVRYLEEFIEGFDDDFDWRPLLPKPYQHYSDLGELLPGEWCGAYEEMAP